MKLIPKLNIDFGIKEFFISIHSILSNRKEEAENNIYYLNHARTGIRLALSSFNLSVGSKIGMTAYNCDTVMQAIKQAGFEIVFLDITEDLIIDLEDLKRKASKLDALVVSHLFGIVNDMGQISGICPAIPIVEDCAHAFLSSNEKHKAGIIGDVSVYSIGLGKFPSISEGGVLRVNNSKYSDAIKIEYNILGSYSMMSEIKLLFRNITYSIAYNPFLYGLITKQLKIKNQKYNKDSAFKELKMSKQSIKLYKNKKKQFTFLKEQQIGNLLFLRNIFQNNCKVKVPNYKFEYSNGFMLPMLTNHRSEFLGEFNSTNLEVSSHFSKSIEWAQNFGYKLDDCKNAEYIAKHIVVIPTHYNLNNKLLERCARLLNIIICDKI